MWKDIVGYEGIYQISDTGRIKRILASQGAQQGKILSLSLDGGGYLCINLYKNKKKTRHRIHRLVLQTFIGIQPSPKHETRHLDGCRINNKYTNLTWGTRRENMEDAVKHGTATIGTKNAGAKFTKGDIKKIRHLLFTGMSSTAIAKQFNVSQSIISDIKTGKSYKNT